MGQGGRRFQGTLVLFVVGSVLLAGPLRAQDRALPAGKSPPETLALEAEKTDVRRDGDEAIAILLGEAHVRYEKKAPKAKDRVLLDVRATSAVGFLPGETDFRRGGPPVRAIYAEGHARLERRTGDGPPFVLEAEQLWIDLVGERVYAIDATARASVAAGAAAPRGPMALGPGSSGGAKPSSVTLRARKLRLEGAGYLEAEGCSFSVCDFGLPHEALEAARVVISERGPRETSRTIDAAAGLGGLGATAIARRADRGHPFRAFRDIVRRRAEAREGSDALFHSVREPRHVSAEGTGVRVRPPFLGEDGFGIPLPVPLAWETDWPFPKVKLGRSSRFGIFATAEMNVPLLRAAILHEGKDDRHVRQGLDLDGTAGGGFYENRGGTATGGAQWGWYGSDGERDARGDFRGTFVRDRATEDRNGTLIPDEERYWVRGLHQQELPLGVHADAEVSKQSDRNYLREYERGVALTQKEQESYLYLRRAWDDLGTRFTARWRLNDFQTQTEELPRARVDWISTPLVTHDVAGGFYLSSFVEAAHLRRRVDDELPLGDDERLGRFDGEARLDYKLPVANLAYFRAWGLGRMTAWSERADGTGSIERFLGDTGARLGTQVEGVYRLSDGLSLRHVLIPEAGYENRMLVTREPGSLIPIDEVETYRRGNFAFVRVRNRLQWAKSATGKEATDLVDVTVEGRYFPTDERLQPDRDRWGTLYGDGRLYLGSYGTWRTVTELDPNRHRVIRLESQITWAVTRWVGSLVRDEGQRESRSLFPDVSIDASYRELADVARAVGWGATVRLTPSWSFRGEELYDVRTREFLRHRITVRRDFHGFALEVAGTYDPILRDTAFSFSVVPSFDSSDDVPPSAVFDDLYGPR